MKKLVIITGSSEGLGKYLAENFLNAGYQVIGISRTNKIKDPFFFFFKQDLSKKSDISKKMNTFLSKNKISKKFEKVILINNAASVLPIDYLHKIDINEVQKSFEINLNSPMKLAHFVINYFQKNSDNILICNVISGAAFHPIINWSTYCTMKSGLKMFSDCLSVDYKDNSKITSITFSPGVMNTNMQKTIRKQAVSKFQNVSMFRDLDKNNKLLSPEHVANKLSHLLQKYKSTEKTDYNINDL